MSNTVPDTRTYEPPPLQQGPRSDPGQQAQQDQVATQTSPAQQTPQGQVAPQGPQVQDQVSDEVVAERFWGFLAPVLAPLAAQAAPALGSALGGLFGGSQGSQVGGAIGNQVGGVLGSIFGGRSILGPNLWDQPMWGLQPLPGAKYPQVGSTFPAPNGNTGIFGDIFGKQVDDNLLQQVCMGCMQKATPDLVQVVKGESQGQRSRGIEPNSTEAMERMWPSIVSFLSQKVTEYLPGVLQDVTTKFLPLIGGRADPQPLTPLMVSAEVNNRWFLPALSTIVSGVQAVLPDLLGSLFPQGQGRGSREWGITWQDLATHGRFWDGDYVRVLSQDPIDQAQVGITLELAPHLSWRKEIEILDDNGQLIERLAVQDANKSATAFVSADQILNNGGLLLKKAKTFGFMAPMYRLSTAGLNDLRGKHSYIRWMAN